MANERDLQFHAALSQAATAVEECLDQIMPRATDPVTEAMRYATLQGGKRLRAFLAVETARLFRVPLRQSVRAAAAVECIHAYSLIHDDLPAMDDDDLRRGKPTVHIRWDEATAILAGDALQSLAFEILTAPQTAPDAAVRVKLIATLAQASGVAGMVGGQAMDIAAEQTETLLELGQIEDLQAKKTGALIRWAVESGAIMGKSNADPLITYSACLGLAFQIRDDLLDIEGDAEALGKRAGKDEAAGKATFVTLLGVEGARKRGEDLVRRACDALSPYGSSAENLRLAAEFAMARTN